MRCTNVRCRIQYSSVFLIDRFGCRWYQRCTGTGCSWATSYVGKNQLFFGSCILLPLNLAPNLHPIRSKGNKSRLTSTRFSRLTLATLMTCFVRWSAALIVRVCCDWPYYYFSVMPSIDSTWVLPNLSIVLRIARELISCFIGFLIPGWFSNGCRKSSAKKN